MVCGKAPSLRSFYPFPALSAMAFLCLFPSPLEDGGSTDVCRGSPSPPFRQGPALAVPAMHSRSQLHHHRHFAFKKNPVLGLLYEPTFASASHAPSCFPSLLFSAPQATTVLGSVEPEAPQNPSCWPAGKRSLTGQNSQAQSLFHKTNHSKFKVKQTRH